MRTIPPPLSPSAPRGGPPAFRIPPFFWGISLVILVAAFSAYLLFFRGPSLLVDRGMQTAERSYSLAHRLAHDIVTALQLQPQVKIGSEVVYEQTKGILELATAQRVFAQSYYWEESWLGSTKKLELRGNFLAKAGYDLTQPFQVEIDPDGRTVRAQVPPAKIVSVELMNQTILQDESGHWNDLKPEDRQAANNALLQLARRNVEKSNLRHDADVELMKRLQSAAEAQKPARVQVKLLRELAAGKN